MIPLSDPNEVSQGKAAIDAARHVPHVVFTSATNADRGTGIPPLRHTKAGIQRHLSDHPLWTSLARQRS